MSGPDTLADPWTEDPDWPVEDWKYDVQNDGTRRGYADWVAANREYAEYEAADAEDENDE